MFSKSIMMMIGRKIKYEISVNSFNIIRIKIIKKWNNTEMSRTFPPDNVHGKRN